jgi:hypothetical protein
VDTDTAAGAILLYQRLGVVFRYTLFYSILFYSTLSYFIILCDFIYSRKEQISSHCVPYRMREQ